MRVLAFKEQQQQGPATTIGAPTAPLGNGNGSTAVAPSTRSGAQSKREYEKINWFKYWWVGLSLAGVSKHTT